MEDQSEFWAAIIGAAVGGALAILAQIVTSMWAARSRRVGLSTSLLIKLALMHSNLLRLRRVVEEQLRTAEASGLGPDLWQKMLPIMHVGDPIAFTAEELGLLLTVRDDALLNILIDADARHNRTMLIADEFSEKRAELVRSLVAEFDDDRGAIRADDPQLTAKRPLILEVESLAKALVTRASKEEEVARSLYSNVYARLRKFGVSSAPKLRTDPDLGR